MKKQFFLISFFLLTNSCSWTHNFTNEEKKEAVDSLIDFARNMHKIPGAWYTRPRLKRQQACCELRSDNKPIHFVKEGFNNNLKTGPQLIVIDPNSFYLEPSGSETFCQFQGAKQVCSEEERELFFENLKEYFLKTGRLENSYDAKEHNKNYKEIFNKLNPYVALMPTDKILLEMALKHVYCFFLKTKYSSLGYSFDFYKTNSLDAKILDFEILYNRIKKTKIIFNNEIIKTINDSEKFRHLFFNDSLGQSNRDWLEQNFKATLELYRMQFLSYMLSYEYVDYSSKSENCIVDDRPINLKLGNGIEEIKKELYLNRSRPVSERIKLLKEANIAVIFWFFENLEKYMNEEISEPDESYQKKQKIN